MHVININLFFLLLLYMDHATIRFWKDKWCGWSITKYLDGLDYVFLGSTETYVDIIFKLSDLFESISVNLLERGKKGILIEVQRGTLIKNVEKLETRKKLKYLARVAQFKIQDMERQKVIDKLVEEYNADK